MRHTKDGHTPGKSYINGDVKYAQKLVDELSGTGRPLTDSSGKWNRKERVKNNTLIGVHVDYETGEETRTKTGIIVYSKTGTHIYPGKRGENK